MAARDTVLGRTFIFDSHGDRYRRSHGMVGSGDDPDLIQRLLAMGEDAVTAVFSTEWTDIRADGIAARAMHNDRVRAT